MRNDIATYLINALLPRKNSIALVCWFLLSHKSMACYAMKEIRQFFGNFPEFFEIEFYFVDFIQFCRTSPADILTTFGGQCATKIYVDFAETNQETTKVSILTME